MNVAQLPPSLEDIELLSKRVLAMLPDPFARFISDIPIRIENWPSSELLSSVGMDDPYSLTGLYRGVPIGERATMTIPGEPEMIFLFRMPILAEWVERDQDLFDVVFDVLTHEIGHHFGMDEDAVLRMEGRSI